MWSRERRPRKFVPAQKKANNSINSWQRGAVLPDDYIPAWHDQFMEKLYTLEQFVDVVNDCLEQKAPELRAAGVALEDPWRPVTDRQVRDYRTKGVTTEAIKHGREVRYTQAHVDEMVELKVAQKTGITSRAYESLKKHLGSTESTSGEALMFLSSTYSVGDEHTPAVQDEGSRLRYAGLAYLSGLNGAAPAPKLEMSASSSMIGAAAGSFGAALNPTPSASCSMLRSALRTSTGRTEALALTWSEWEPVPGIRLQVRSDKLASWTEEDAKALLEIMKNFANSDN
jgi:hypothetical protein